MKQWLETREVLDRLTLLVRAGGRAALATVARVRGSAYRREGAKLLVAEDGSATGNVSGGCVEQDVREVALQVIASGTPQLRSYCSGVDEIAAWDLGMGCEGQVDVYVEPALEPRARERELLDGRAPFAVATLLGTRETGSGKRVTVTASGADGDLGSSPLTGEAVARARQLLRDERAALEEIAGRPVFIDVFLPPPELVLCGAGDDAQPLARCAADVGLRVIVVDRRPALLTAERFPTAARLETPVSYIGMLGPRRRTERILGALDPGSSHAGERVYGPVGLDIGTDGAEQVALSVVAEILAVRSGRRARSL